MTLYFLYGDRQANWSSVNLGTSAVRLSGWTLNSSAESGVPDSSTITIDDPTGDSGHSSDQFLGLKTFVVYDTAAGVSNTRIFTGYTADREYESDGSLITEDAVRITMSVADINQEATFHVIASSDGNRSAETVGERLTWLMGSVYIVATDGGLVVYPTTSMDANDYRNQTAADVLDDLAQAVGYNWFIYFDESTNSICLFFDDPNTSTAYTSNLRLSNVLSEVDSKVQTGAGPTQTWAPMHPKLRRSPATTASGAVLPYASSTLYRYRAATADTYGFVDRVMADANVKTLTQATARADRFLWQSSTEQDILNVSVQLPPGNVNDVREGQRMQVKFRQLPGYKADFVWCRVLHRSVGQADDTNEFYTVDLTLSPQEEPQPAGSIVQEAHVYIGGVSATVTLPNPVTPGNLLVVAENRWKGNGTSPVSPYAGAGDSIGGSGAWTLLTPVVWSSVSGDRSGLGMWAKTASDSQSSGPVFSGFTWVDLYELANVTTAGATIISQDVPGAASDLNVGSLSSPDAGDVAIMIVAQYCNLCGTVLFSPNSDWTVDNSYGATYFSSRQPYWVGHSLGDGTATTAEVGASVSANWCGIAVNFPAV